MKYYSNYIEDDVEFLFACITKDYNNLHSNGVGFMSFAIYNKSQIIQDYLFDIKDINEKKLQTRVIQSISLDEHKDIFSNVILINPKYVDIDIIIVAEKIDTNNLLNEYNRIANFNMTRVGFSKKISFFVQIEKLDLETSLEYYVFLRNEFSFNAEIVETIIIDTHEKLEEWVLENDVVWLD